MQSQLITSYTNTFPTCFILYNNLNDKDVVQYIRGGEEDEIPRRDEEGMEYLGWMGCWTLGLGLERHEVGLGGV